MLFLISVVLLVIGDSVILGVAIAKFGTGDTLTGVGFAAAFATIAGLAGVVAKIIKQIGYLD